MKKRTLVLLAVLMAVTFLFLVLLESIFFSSLADLRRKHFEDGVRRTLYQTSRILEEEETTLYLHDTMRKLMDEDETFASLTKEVSDTSAIKLGSYESRALVQMQGTPMQVLTNNLHKKLKDNFARRRILVNEVAMNWLKDSEQKSIEQRVDMKHVERLIHRELLNNGLDEAFYCKLVNFKGQVVYTTECKDSTVYEGTYYSQLLFPNDFNPKMNLIRVYFPGEKNYVFSPFSSLMIISVIITFMLLCTFISTIVLMFRQYNIAESKTDFMNNMTHEFKTPISSISLASQMLCDENIMKSPEVLKNISQIIRDETKRLSFQVEKVLQISLLENERSIMKFTDMDVNLIIEDVVNNFKLKVKSKKGSISTELKASNAVATVDELHFTNVIFNLLDNAIKYSKMDEPPHLKVRTWNDNEGKAIYISVQDNGIGIRRDQLKKIFEKFHRVSTGNVHNVKGFGLGLAYVKKIVEKHNGSIKAESELGEGTTFIITLPTLKNKKDV